MNLKDQVRSLLDGLAPFEQATHLLEAKDGNQLHLQCELVSLDRLACAFEQLLLTNGGLSGTPIARLKQIAEQLSARLTYLLEPISPIEIDAQGCTVQMRSNPPQKEADKTTYYELLVEHTGQLRLSRYSRTAGNNRTLIPAEVTREVLLRLVADFADVAK